MANEPLDNKEMSDSTDNFETSIHATLLSLKDV